ncbi:MAG: DUF2837 family protein [Candidatus Eremiobacteraeota bacterium]|nr:DUF2837 family protein [Candidatus Eremiobacteraeota bacterium]
MLNLHLLSDPRLCFIVLISGVVAMLGSLNIASRPAAVVTGKVAQATTIAGIAFMFSRLANMFYQPLMAGYTGGNPDPHILFQQVQLVVVGSALGGLASWLLLPNFISMFCAMVEQLDEHGIKSFLKPAVAARILGQFAKRYPMGVRLGQLHGIPKSFLFFNVFATAVWTVGALSAIYCSGAMPAYKSTALLLSGLVNSFAAIAFTMWVDPQAALITDDVVENRRPREQIFAAAIHLGLGNFVGGILGLAVMHVSIALIGQATLQIGSQGSLVAGSIWPIIALNVGLTILASTSYAARVSAVITRQVALALAIYNFFNLITRLSQQIYLPLVGSMSDFLVNQHQVDKLENQLRGLIGGASFGALLGLLLLPTFIEIINQAIRQMQRHGSMAVVVLRCLRPASWPVILGCLRPPSFMGVGLADLKRIPNFFLIGNVLVLSIHTMGSFAAVCAGAHLSALAANMAQAGQENSTMLAAAGAATLLSSVVNGIATITLSLVVDPSTSRITDQCRRDNRPLGDIKTTALFLMLGMLGGTLLSQVFFTPARLLIQHCAVLLATFLGK